MNDMILTFIILIVTTIAFVFGRWRSDLVAVAALIALSITGIVTPQEALAGFSNSVVIMIAGLFIVGAGIFNTGLANQIGKQIIKLGGKSEIRMLVIVMLTVGCFSAFMSNTGTVAILLPVVMSMALQMKVSPAKFLIPLSYASSLGGAITLIGTPPNLVVNAILKEQDLERFHFFGFTPIGIVALITGILFMVFFGRKLLPNGADFSSVESTNLSSRELAGFYKIYDHLFLLKVLEGSSISSKSLTQINLPEKYGVTVITIKRKGNERFPFQSKIPHLLTPKEQIKEEDLILAFGEQEAIEKISHDYQLQKLEWKNKEDIHANFFSRVFGLTEILITPQSNFVGKTLKDVHFRSKYHCNALAINRRGKYIQENVSNTKFRVGDAIIVHGKWEDIELIDQDQSNIVVVGKVVDEAGTAFAAGKASIAGLIMLFMLVLMTTEWISPVMAVIIAAFLMIVTGCVRSMNDAYQKINWESVVLIAAMLPLATALEKTGGVTFISKIIIDALGDYGPYAILTGFYFLTMTLSQFISNTATAVVFAPVALAAAQALEISPYPLLMGVAVAASMAFSTPVASPTNAMVMSAGGYQFKDYVKVGLPLQLILAIVMIIFIPFVYPF
ncbi:SLC13 family permease [Bacillus sp. FJAT-49705]|uniref:SLC13 family permease n=1 Tax=Cytobacillus citreus TaxID=2833586 RepID=A0ABS5NXM7_9BACI|nr:SLC13 family permease [Cytobacillus citreus]MBS4192597.1 SLC13 family permease [Cytobacillus citreus]